MVPARTVLAAAEYESKAMRFLLAWGAVLDSALVNMMAVDPVVVGTPPAGVPVVGQDTLGMVFAALTGSQTDMSDLYDHHQSLLADHWRIQTC